MQGDCKMDMEEGGAQQRAGRKGRASGSWEAGDRPERHRPASTGDLRLAGRGRSDVKRTVIDPHHQLQYLARRVAALRLAFGMRPSWRYVRTHQNHADAPSRGRPVGVLPAAEKMKAHEPPGARLPDFFYQLTRG